MNEDLKQMVNSGEKILWEGRPDSKCFKFETIFNPLLPFAIVWLLFDGFVMGFGLSTAFQMGQGFAAVFMIPFFLLHLMPVWLYLGGIILMRRRYQNTYYIVTDRAIYISGGVITKHVQTKPFAEMSHIDLHRGIFDQKFNVGDVICTSSQHSTEGATSAIKISSISNYIDVFNMVKKLQQDVYADIMYPNDKRTSENHGYNTEYKGM